MRSKLEQIAGLLDFGFRSVPSERRVLTSRVDRDVCFDQAGYALAAITQRSATDIQLAVLKNREPPNGER